jgi:hypothetical protein
VSRRTRDPCRQLTRHPRPGWRPQPPTTGHDPATCALGCRGRGRGRPDHGCPPGVPDGYAIAAAQRTRPCLRRRCATGPESCAAGMCSRLRTAEGAVRPRAAQPVERAQPDGRGRPLQGCAPDPQAACPPCCPWLAPPPIPRPGRRLRVCPLASRGRGCGRGDHERGHGFCVPIVTVVGPSWSVVGSGPTGFLKANKYTF